MCHHFPAKKHSSSDFKVAVTICSNFGVKKRKSVSTSTFSIFHAVMGPDAMILVFLFLIFLIFSLKLALSLSYQRIRKQQTDVRWVGLVRGHRESQVD